MASIRIELCRQVSFCNSPGNERALRNCRERRNRSTLARSSGLPQNRPMRRALPLTAILFSWLPVFAQIYRKRSGDARCLLKIKGEHPSMLRIFTSTNHCGIATHTYRICTTHIATTNRCGLQRRTQFDPESFCHVWTAPWQELSNRLLAISFPNYLAALSDLIGLRHRVVVEVHVTVGFGPQTNAPSDGLRQFVLQV